MISQAPRNWISSPLGINVLLSLCGSKGTFVDKYIKIYSDLKSSNLVNIGNKLLITPTENVKCNSGHLKEIQEVNFIKDDLTNVFSTWTKRYGVFKHDILEYLTPETTSLFLNISSMKAKWKSAIDGKAPVMKIYNSFNYTEDIKYEAKILELPLQDDSMKLVLIVPNEKDTLLTLVDTLTSKGLDQAVSSIQPLFTVTSELTPKRIHFDSKMINKIDTSKTAIQYGGVDVDENGVSAKVLTCLLSNSKEFNDSRSKQELEPSSFFFAVTFKGTAIFTGSFTPS